MDKKGQVITRERLWILIIAIVFISLIITNVKLSDKIIMLLVFSLLINPILSFFINKWIDGFHLDWLNEVNITFEIEGYELSITAYTLLSAILLFILFR